MSTLERNVRGLLGTKLGMTQTWDENNRVVPVTVVAAGTNVVTQVRQPRDRRLQRRPDRLRRDRGPQGDQAAAGHFEKAGVTPRRHLLEIRTADAASYSVGQELSPELFAAGEEVDVTGTSKGKGYAGVMKRHGFHGVARLPRCAPQPPQAGLDRRLRHPGSRLQGHADGRPDGWRHRHHPERHRPRRRRREGPDPAQGCRSRPQGRPRGHPFRGQGPHRPRRSPIMTRQDSEGRLPGRDLRRPGQHPVDPPGRRRSAGRRSPGHPRRPRRRGEVRGGGRKPYKQKGTGRARQGSIRAPQFAGGGVVHGPTPRSYDQRTPKKMKAAALRGALSDRARAGRVHVVEAFVTGDKPSTKAALAALTGLTDRPRTLVVLERGDDLTWLSLRNVDTVHLLAVDQLNTYDVLLSDDVVFTKGAYDAFVAGPADRQVGQGRGHVDREQPRRRPSEQLPQGPPRRADRAGREREELRPARREQVHLPGASRTPTRPRSRSRSRRCSTSR